MQPVRASKRRKLDQENAAKSSPSSRHPTAFEKKAKQVPVVPVVQNSPEDLDTANDEVENGNGNALSSHDIWKQAKAKIATRKGKRPSVYDDIDGANVGREPYGRMEKPKRTRTRTKPEPSKPVAAAPLNFFKQFAKAKAAAPAEEEEDEDEDDGSIPDSEDGDDSDSIQVKQPSRNGKSWTLGTAGASKKTFEDEIREVEQEARRKASEKDGDSEDELAENGEMRRSSSRQSSIHRTTRHVSGHKGTNGVAPKASKPKPLDRRKANRAHSVASSDDDDDDIEIDDSEDGRVRPNPVQVSTPKRPKSQPFQRTVSTISLPPFPAEHLQCIQKIILEKCTGKRPIPLTNLTDEFAKVNSLINQTITAGESNSMLLIGGRGSGKTALINQILREQSIKHPNDYHIVRLSGFVHTDDKIALREIWRQLGREMDIEDSETSKNYADTLTTLLALLSHPAETGRDEEGQVTKSVIFILDEFELFATHPRQTLLYNLFDIAQSRKAPIAVLGCTTRIDVAESLEKRVKSRFSHRYVHLSMSKSFNAFYTVARSAMRIEVAELEPDENYTLGAAVNGVVAKLQKAALSSANGKHINGDHDEESGTLEQWNTLVSAVLSTKACTSFLNRRFHTTKSIPEFLSSLMLAMATLQISAINDSSDLLDHLMNTISSYTLHPPDSKLSILESLSSLQLALLICAARLTNIYNSEIISFALAYEEYKNLASKAKLQASASGAMAQGAGSRVWGKGVAKGAWEGLVECGLILEDGRGGRVDVAMEEIGGSGVELGSWGRWCREI